MRVELTIPAKIILAEIRGTRVSALDHVEVVDVCFGCGAVLEYQGVNTMVLHPPYEDTGDYTCFLCGLVLEDIDYGYT